MECVATVDSQNRIEIPEDLKAWFRPGSKYVINREGELVTLRPLKGLAALLERAERLKDPNAPSLEEINAEVHAARAEKTDQ